MHFATCVFTYYLTIPLLSTKSSNPLCLHNPKSNIIQFFTLIQILLLIFVTKKKSFSSNCCI